MTFGKQSIVGVLSSGIAMAFGATIALWDGLQRDGAHNAQEPKRSQNASDAAGQRTKRLREVRPIVTNLAEPAGAWVRVELALVISGSPSAKLDEFVAEFVSDTTDFLRTVTAQEVQGTNGLRRLREDLLDRARFRIGAAAEAVLIQTLVVQ